MSWGGGGDPARGDPTLVREVALRLSGGPVPIPDPDGDAEAIVLDAERAMGGDNSAAIAERAFAHAAQRAKGMPLAYVIGRVRFMGLDLVVAPGALVPRQETEILGRAAVEILSSSGSSVPLRVIDMCCGSGNLACAIASFVAEARVWASDLLASSVAVAQENVEQLGLGSRVEVFEGDLFAPLSGLGLEGTIDVLVTNPPYISTGRLGKDRAELLAYEPREAFDGGPYGLTIHQRVIKEGLPFLRPGGTLLFEIGEGQERQVSLLFARARAYEVLPPRTDSAGRPRVIAARKAVL